jgi:hypothetical protein
MTQMTHSMMVRALLLVLLSRLLAPCSTACFAYSSHVVLKFENGSRRPVGLWLLLVHRVRPAPEQQAHPALMLQVRLEGRMSLVRDDRAAKQKHLNSIALVLLVLALGVL